MPNESSKAAIGRQTQLPFKRALEISLKSLKIRFWRSMITAAGIFLGIAFLTVVLTQSLLQWPIPEKVDAGFVRVSGQVNGPGDYDVWTPASIEEGLKAGIPKEVLDRVNVDGQFNLRDIVQGAINAERAEKKLRRLKREWQSLSKIKDDLAFYVSVASDADIKVRDALKRGVPTFTARNLAIVAAVRKDLEKRLEEEGANSDSKEVRALKSELDFYMAAAADPRVKLADAAKYGVPKGRKRKTPGADATFKGGDLAEIIRQQPDWVNVLFASAALDQDVTIKDAVRQGVPETVARRLAGQGNTFKPSALNDLIKTYPDEMKKWKRRAERNAIFKTVPKSAIAAIARTHARTLNDVLADAKQLAKEADRTNVMIVNTGRKIKVDFSRFGQDAGKVKLVDGDNIYVPDRNTRYRMIWLVVMSLLVCTVGITNSMLMSVTERFKEIGTMKCLGALDKFIVELFMLESGMMGGAASILGWLTGFLLMLIVAISTTGWDVIGNLEAKAVLLTFVEAVVVGMLLTIVATIAPAKRAADMPPAMALRSEI
ncbi:MAG: FtsX-like permease family protein [Armatimonadota bacterium]|nr:FtsX-like permease family protein [Armatimonadota bacterium]